MGLREQKAQRTRDAVSDAALTLFEERGYAATTMEQIAARAEISPATLYRYFPTKESTLTSQLLPEFGGLALALVGRPREEALPRALSEALRTVLTEASQQEERLTRVRRLIDATPEARARVWDSWYEEVAALERAIAEREDRDPADLWIRLTAQSSMTVVHMSLDRMRTVGAAGLLDYADEVVRALGNPSLVLPAPLQPGGAAPVEPLRPGR